MIKSINIKMSYISYTIMYVLRDSVVSSLCFKCWEFKATYEPERFKLINQIYFFMLLLFGLPDIIYIIAHIALTVIVTLACLYIICCLIMHGNHYLSFQLPTLQNVPKMIPPS